MAEVHSLTDIGAMKICSSTSGVGLTASSIRNSGGINGSKLSSCFSPDGTGSGGDDWLTVESRAVTEVFLSSRAAAASLQSQKNMALRLGNHFNKS